LTWYDTCGCGCVCGRSASREVVGQVVPVGVSVELSNGALVVNASLSDRQLNIAVDNLLDGTSHAWTQQMLEYTSYTGTGQKSVRNTGARCCGPNAETLTLCGWCGQGAYIFRPVGPATALPSGDGTLTFVDGPLVQELRHRYDAAHIQASGSTCVSRVTPC
jgi:hypothetical protein